MLKENHWHCGYAIEAAIACKAYAFDQLHQPKVYSIIKADNYASMNVAKRNGMCKEAEFMACYYNGKQLHFLYSITK